jgi:two-component system, OmpR family, KDP operon response regulator KdpE
VTGARILVADDEVQIRRFLGISLRAQGYAVSEAGTAAQALEGVVAGQAELLVLDLGLPDLDGIEVLRQLRAWSQVPVIVLSARAGEGEKVRALDAGANDYVTKPFGVQELSARIRGLLRQVRAGDAQAAFDDGDLCIDLGKRRVMRGGGTVALSRKEWALLALLMRHAGRVVTQPQLLRELWGPTHQEDLHYLRILAAKLRAKLGDDAAAPRYIQTEPGVGLRFVGEPA